MVGFVLSGAVLCTVHSAQSPSHHTHFNSVFSGRDLSETRHLNTVARKEEGFQNGKINFIFLNDLARKY